MVIIWLIRVAEAAERRREQEARRGNLDPDKMEKMRQASDRGASSSQSGGGGLKVRL